MRNILLSFSLSFIFLFLFTGVKTVSETRQISDKVQALLDELEDAVQAAIDTAQAFINAGVDDSELRRQNNYDQMADDVQSAFLTAWLRVLKVLEISVGYDIVTCLTREDELLSMPDKYKNESTTCLAPWDQAFVTIRGSSNYQIGAQLTTVDNLRNRASDCDLDSACLGPIIEQIATSHDDIPRRIDAQVQLANNSLYSVDRQVNGCIGAAVPKMTQNGKLLVDEMELCADEIIGN